MIGYRSDGDARGAVRVMRRAVPKGRLQVVIGGRGRKLTDDLQGKIVAAVKAGNDNVVAAGASGVGEKTFYRWLERGSDDAPCASPHDDWVSCRKGGHKSGACPGNDRFRQFRQAVTLARYECEVSLVRCIAKAAPKDYRAAMVLLRAKWPERWNPPERTEVSGPGGEAIDLSSARDRLLARLETTHLRLVGNRSEVGEPAPSNEQPQTGVGSALQNEDANGQ